MNRATEDRIGATAVRQHGVVTRAQLLEAGLSPSAVGRRLRSGRLRQLHRGVYAVGLLTPVLAREMAAILASGAGAVLSHFSAAVLWGLVPATSEARGAMQDNREPVDVTLTANRGRRPGIRVHRVLRLDVDDRSVREGIPVTSPARTLVDLAGMVDSRMLEGSVARAEREGLVTRAELAERVACRRGRTGTPALRALLEAGSPPAFTRSEAEARFLALVREAGLPAPEVNVKIGPYEIDFLWRSQGIAVEVDGYRYHSTRPRFEGDRRKDAWLMAGGIKVLRLSWRQITQEALATAVQVGQALARANSDPRGRDASP